MTTDDYNHEEGLEPASIDGGGDSDDNNDKHGAGGAILAGEWSYLFDVDEVGQKKPAYLSISPSDEEMSSIANRLGIEGISALKADMEIRRNPGNMVIHVSGRITARVAQKCVVTLDTVEEDVDTPFEGWFADKTQALSFTKAKRERELEKQKGEQPILSEEEDPEPIIDGKIDIGELVVQYLSLGLNPYPRKEGASYEGKFGESSSNIQGASKTGEVYENPFMALKDWKKKESDS